MTGVDVLLPFEIAFVDASIGRIADLQGLTGERPLPAEFRAFSGSLVDPPSARNRHSSRAIGPSGRRKAGLPRRPH
jgi:hypothetical protein